MERSEAHSVAGHNYDVQGVGQGTCPPGLLIPEIMEDGVMADKHRVQSVFEARGRRVSDWHVTGVRHDEGDNG